MHKNLIAQPSMAQYSRRFAYKEQRRLLKSFWIGIIVLFPVVIVGIEPTSIEGFIEASLIAVAALLPSYLWCSGRALGIPIFPVFALSFLVTYAWPLLWDHPAVMPFSSESKLLASVTVAAFLGLGTLIWLMLVKSPKAPPKFFWALGNETASSYLLLFLASGVFVTMGIRGGWFISMGYLLIPLIRGVSLGLSAIAAIALAYRLGNRELSRREARIFFTLIILYLMATAISFLMVGAVSAFLLVLVGFGLARKRVAWLAIFLSLPCLVVMHHGKGVMRAKYLTGTGNDALIQPWQYPETFIEWGNYGVKDLMGIPTPEYVSYEESTEFKERVSLIQLLMLTQQKAPEDVPYLYGETYAVIPELLVPRFLAAEKLNAHEGNSLLNIYYGQQTRSGTETTTIGWGLLNESYANFGFYGCAGLAILMGAFYGFVARWSMSAPFLSSRSLFALLVVSFAFQVEFCMSVYVTSLFQSTVPLVVITFLLMKVQRVKEAPNVTDREAMRYLEKSVSVPPSTKFSL